MAYNGYKDWDHWNVSLWINNDETIYNAAYIMVSSMGAKKGTDTADQAQGVDLDAAAPNEPSDDN